MKVREVMSPTIHTVSMDDNLTTAAKLMSQYDIGSVPVCSDKMLHGIVTDRDIVIRCVAEGKDCSSTKVSEIMTTKPVIATPEMDIHEASQLMAEHQISRLPVVDNGKICGMLALGDMAVVGIHEDEAGEALSCISKDVHH